MKFLIIAPRFHTNLYYRAKALQDDGHRVKVAILYKGKSEFYESIDVQMLKLSVFSRLISSILKTFKKNYLKTAFELRIEMPDKKLNKLVKEYKPDVVLLKAYQNMLAIKSLVVAKKYNAKVLMFTQTPFAHIKGSVFLFKLNIKLFQFLKVYAYITPIKSNYYAFHDFGVENIYYLPFVYPIKGRVWGLNEQIKILSIGKFQKRKDQLLLLKVVNQLIKEQCPVNLCLIGELADKDYFNTISNYIKRKSISEYVCVKTNLSYQEIQNEYVKHDLFVLPAYNEPAAYSPVEALANGLPVICSDENGTKCYIENGINGYVFDARNEDGLRNGIKNIVLDIKKLEQMQQNAILTAKENHLPEKFAKRIIQIAKNEISIFT